MMRVAFIGAGRAARGLAHALPADYPVVAISSRGDSARELAEELRCTAVSPLQASLMADVVLVATPDSAIARVVEEISFEGGWRPGQIVAHLSGALTSEVLAPLRRFHCSVASFHPLQSFAGSSNSLQGVVFAIEGDPGAVSVLRDLAIKLGGVPLELDAASKSLYHAAAAMVSNYTVALLAAASEVLVGLGLDERLASYGLLALLKGTLSNVEAIGLPGCLTGPIARGDADTVRSHIDALEARYPELADVYKALGRITLPVAIAAGKGDPTGWAAIERMLEDQHEGDR
jgi:predicted short-subunit dehydrogenase-like oxidoreductase (DUF2520 family)